MSEGWDALEGGVDATGKDYTQLQQAGAIGSKPFTTFVDSGMKEKYDIHGKSRDKVIHSYDKDNRTILGHQTDEAKEIRDDSNTDAVRTQMDPQWQHNHGKGNYRGNLNNKSFEQTLNLSRAADALNNSRHWDPGTMGRTTNSKFGSQAAQMGKSERWEPIETQEMRQMRQNEEMEKQVRERDVKRQGDTQDYALDLQKKADEARFNLSQALNMSDKDVEQALRQAAINVNMNLPAQTRASQMITNFAEELKLYTDTTFGNYVVGVFNKCGPEVAQIIGSTRGVSSPGYDAVLRSKIRQVAYSNTNDPMAAEATVNLYTALTYGNYGLGTFSGIGN